MRIYKIAKKIIAEYKYIYDPEHILNPGGEFTHRTEYGWSNKEDGEGLKLIKENIGGSTGAKIYEDDEGNKYVVKTYHGNAKQAFNEYLTNKLYKELGVNVPATSLVEVNGQVGVANKFVDKLSYIDFYRQQYNPKFKEQVLDKFYLDALLANWDTVGLEYDNLLQDANGDFYRIDNGGALEYRAQGGLKGDRFGVEVGEWDTLRDISMNSSSADVFSSITDEDIAMQVLENYDKTFEAINSVFADIDVGNEEVNMYYYDLGSKLLDRLDNMRTRAEETLPNYYSNDKMGNGKPFPLTMIPTTITDKERMLIEDKSKSLHSNTFKYNISSYGDIPQNKSLRKLIDKKYEDLAFENDDMRLGLKSIKRTIEDFGLEGSSSNSLMSTMVKKCFGYQFNDHRIDMFGEEQVDDCAIKALPLYMKKEQEILLKTGFVDKEGFVYLFRNTSDKQALRPIDEKKYGANVIKYKGGYAESWSFNPMTTVGGDIKVVAKVPLEKVIASSVGEDLETGQFIHHEENEVLINADEINTCFLLSTASGKNEYFGVANDIYSETLRDNNKNCQDIIEAQVKREQEINKIILDNIGYSNPYMSDLESSNNRTMSENIAFYLEMQNRLSENKDKEAEDEEVSDLFAGLATSIRDLIIKRKSGQITSEEFINQEKQLKDYAEKNDFNYNSISLDVFKSFNNELKSFENEFKDFVADYNYFISDEKRNQVEKEYREKANLYGIDFDKKFKELKEEIEKNPLGF